MEMRRLSAAGGDRMDVEIENPSVDRGDRLQSRFLESFPACGVEQTLALLDVTSQLQPPVESAVVMKQKAPRIIDDERTRSEVSGEEMLPRERRRCGFREADHRIAMPGFAVVGGYVTAQLPDQIVHAQEFVFQKMGKRAGAASCISA